MKPKIALIAGPKNSATEKVMRPLKEGLRDDFDITMLPTDMGDWPSRTLGKFDLVHTSYLGYVFPALDVPLTANVWQIGSRFTDYQRWLMNVPVDRFVVDEPFTRMQLGQMEHLSVVEIPLAPLPYSGRLPLPEEFTVGYFGNNYKSKRFSVIEQAAEECGVPLAKFGFETSRPVYALTESEIYGKMSVLVHASFHDTNSLVAMEALQRGRPVISTWSPGLDRTLTNNLNGLWFDGSVEDLVMKIREMKDNFDRLQFQASCTILPSTEETTAAYKEMFNDVLNSN